MKLNHKSFPLRIEVKEDGDARTVEGWASTFGNKDSYDDIVMPGAFADSIKGRMPKMLWQHDSQQPVGIWTAAKETDQGLYVKGELLDTTLGNDVYKMLKAGAITDMSIGYSTIDSSMDHATGVRMLKKLDLWEVSLVTFPANDKANITMVKNMKSVMDDIGDAVTFLEQAMGLCDAYGSGDMQPTAELMGTIHDLIDQAQDILIEDRIPDGDDDSAADAKKFSPKVIEKILREAGVSRNDARGIVSKGYKAIAGQREAEGQEHMENIKNLLNQFKA